MDEGSRTRLRRWTLPQRLSAAIALATVGVLLAVGATDR